MKLQNSYTVIVTPKNVECRDFYVRWFECEVVVQVSWFALLRVPGDPPGSVAFMAPDHPSAPPGPETFNGLGAFLTFQVADAAAEYRRLNQAGATFAYDLRDEPWGQRRFALRDPAGTWIDVVEQINPVPGFFDRHP